MREANSPLSAFLQAVSGGHRNSPREDLRGCQPSERLSRATVELGGNRIEVFRGMSREIAPFWESTAAGVHSRSRWSRLPWAMRIAEVHLYAGVDREACVLSHFLATVPRHRAPELRREKPDIFTLGPQANVRLRTLCSHPESEQTANTRLEISALQTFVWVDLRLIG